MARKPQYNRALTFVLSIIFFLVGVLAGFFASYSFIIPSKSLPTEVQEYLSQGTHIDVSGDFSIHFMELGNSATGDCIYIKAGETDILIDGGSYENSMPTITKYINTYVKDKKLEYVIVTHADRDHIVNFAIHSDTKESLFDKYEIGTIIDFAQVTKERPTREMYQNYLLERDEAISRGAKHYTALDCVNHTNGANDLYELAPSITMKILNQKYYAEVSTDENNHSVCTLFTHGDRNFLLTGDLEKEGEESLFHKNQLPKCELFKAGHHGSYSSTTEALLDKINPEICVVTCCAGHKEKHKTPPEHVFPSQEFVDRISKYTTRVYVPTVYVENHAEGEKDYKSMNGNVVVISNETEVKVQCSNNNTLLKDSEWFKANRTCPPEWKQVA